ncbi:MAG: translation initiation factor IF-2 N-terminal domain-containing protein, partial [Duncaniella sp.]|nr:translation initiation factor IF-2 N-terminal domain-containing protein [Duncaniella sp.]
MPRIKISQAAKEFNVSIPTVVEQLQKKGITIDANPNTRIDEAAYDILVEAFQPDRKVRELIEKKRHDKEAEKSAPASQDEVKIAAPSPGIEFKVLGKIDLDANNNAVKEKTPAHEEVVTAPAPAPVKAETPKEEKKPEAPAPVKAEAPKEEKKPEAPAPVKAEAP